MATKFDRSVTADQANLTVHRGTRTSRWEAPGRGVTVHEVQTHHNPKAYEEQSNSANPLIFPYHWHWYQDVYFRINKGRYIFTIEGQEIVKSSEDGIILIPKTLRHSFRVDPTFDGECEIVMTASRSESGISEKFYRNFYSYLDDCEKQQVQPSLPQLLLLLDDAQVSLAFPGPPKLMQWISWAFGVMQGRWFGGYILGYKTSYEEYYDAKGGKGL